MAMAMHLSETFSIIEPSTTTLCTYHRMASLGSVLFLSLWYSTLGLLSKAEKQAPTIALLPLWNFILEQLKFNEFSSPNKNLQ